MLTPYQNIVKSHLCSIFSKGLLYTDEVVLHIKTELFRDWVVQLSLDYGYVPIFNDYNIGKHVIVSFVKKIVPC